jgi:hypothetical protein
MEFVGLVRRRDRSSQEYPAQRREPESRDRANDLHKAAKCMKDEMAGEQLSFQAVHRRMSFELRLACRKGFVIFLFLVMSLLDYACAPVAPAARNPSTSVCWTPW